MSENLVDNWKNLIPFDNFVRKVLVYNLKPTSHGVETITATINSSADLFNIYAITSDTYDSDFECVNNTDMRVMVLNIRFLSGGTTVINDSDIVEPHTTKSDFQVRRMSIIFLGVAV